jgi:excisionase family DNA binding protein
MSEVAIRYLRAKEIAGQLDVSIRTVRRWISNGTLPSIRIGGVRLVAEDDLLRLLRQRASSSHEHFSAQQTARIPED